MNEIEIGNLKFTFNRGTRDGSMILDVDVPLGESFGSLVNSEVRELQQWLNDLLEAS